MPTNRYKYQFLGNWCWEVIYGEYPMWKELVDGAAEAAAKGWTQITVTKEMLSNQKGKEYSDARLGTIKLNPIEHTIAVPEGKQVVRVVVHGFSNSEVASEMTINNNHSPITNNHYSFPGKGFNPIYTTHVIDLTEPADNLSLTISEAQCCVTIRVYCQ